MTRSRGRRKRVERDHCHRAARRIPCLYRVAVVTITKPTGHPNHRPPIPLWEHPFRYVLALADAFRARGMTAQKAYLIATSVFFAENAELIPIADLSKKMQRVFEQQGGIPVAYDLPASGNPNTRKIKECAQAVDTLAKMDKRYSKGADLAYRTELGVLMQLVMLETGGPEMRKQMIDIMVARLESFGDHDPQTKELADLIR
jgi:hypothetical protein